MSISSKTELLNKQISVVSEIKLTYDEIQKFSRLTITDFRILRKFYFTGKSFPNDTEGYAVSQLIEEIGRHNIEYTVEGLRKRLDMLVKMGFLEKIKSWPCIYNPVKNPENLKGKLNNFFSNFFNF